MDPQSNLPQAAAGLDLSRLPRHVAIIMDGNGRWAKRRGLRRVRGHAAGAESVRVVVRLARRLGIKYLTLYAFSEENWQRPSLEIRALMSLLSRYLRQELPELHQNNIVLRAIGDLRRLPESIQRELARVEELTREGARMTLSLALSYGGRSEIVRAAQSLAQDLAAGRLQPQDITPESFASRLYTAGMPDPDLTHPHQRRVPPEQFSPLANRLHRTVFHRHPLARLPGGGIRQGPPRIPAPGPPLRPHPGAGGGPGAPQHRPRLGRRFFP